MCLLWDKDKKRKKARKRIIYSHSCFTEYDSKLQTALLYYNFNKFIVVKEIINGFCHVIITKSDDALEKICCN